MVTARQLSAARVLLERSQQDAADWAGIALNTLNTIERGTSDPRKSTWDMIVQAFTDPGIASLPPSSASLQRDEGVRLRREHP
jgi:predicted transcriptional regulator